jgi:hypothetical protein
MTLGMSGAAATDLDRYADEAVRVFITAYSPPT